MYRIKVIACFSLMILSMCIIFAKSAETNVNTKKFDLSKYHNVGNIWLRVSNYGFFGSGNDVVPQYPSLEYPGGSGIDYLYQGALWFGAKKYRRNAVGKKLYWLAQNPSYPDSTGVTAEGDPNWNVHLKPIIDTLVTVGFDGDADLYEFLPAYNPLISGYAAVQDQYNLYNTRDEIAYASSRFQKRGVDDDGDGRIDEDFVGYTFPLRPSNELPVPFSSFGDQFISNTFNYNIISNPNNYEIWFPLGFMRLSDTSNQNFNFSEPYDDDHDGQYDEDGAPVSEQDFVSYYYDYCPFNSPGERDWGSSRSSNTHVPLKVRVRQMSYQWSYRYIWNLVYVEFDITNMNIATRDTLFDCAMGIYMDSDVGPQSYGSEKASDDVSGYVKGKGYEFAFTRDQDGDNGLTIGRVGSRVCTPDPEKLKFDCWYWKVGDGPDDSKPQSLNYSPKRTANEKYWLLTGKSPDNKFLRLRPESDAVTEFEQPSKADTRYLFAFYGAQPGTSGYADSTKWNLAPGNTMKIVIAVFPGDTSEELKRSARWAKEIYGVAQTLTTVCLPDTFPHYRPPEPPEIPKVFAELVDDGNAIDVYWDNRSEFSYDTKTVSVAVLGWQNPTSPDFIAGLDSDPNPAVSHWDDPAFPEEFKPNASNINPQAKVNPYTAYRLRHDFQGYSVWGRSGSGSQEDWVLCEKWDKIDTDQDHSDYRINSNNPTYYIDYGGYLGADKDLPNRNAWNHPDQYSLYYRYDDNYFYTPQTSSDPFYGWPIYAPDKDWTVALQNEADALAANPTAPTAEEKLLQARLFKHPDLRDDIFFALVDDKMIPLRNHGGQVAIPVTSGDTDRLVELKKARLARRYYKKQIVRPVKGTEYYVAVTAYDRGIPSQDLDYLETGRDTDANMKVFFPGNTAKSKMDNIYVVPNPYIGRSKFDGRRENDKKGDKSRRMWFVNIPERCKIRIYTLAGDLVDEIDHNGEYQEDVINISKAATLGIAASGIHSWDLLSKNNQIIASGVYLYSVENKATGKIKVGKFVVVK